MTHRSVEFGGRNFYVSSKIPHLKSNCYYPISMIEELEKFENFSPNISEAAIKLRASGLTILQLHFYTVALNTGLEVAR